MAELRPQVAQDFQDTTLDWFVTCNEDDDVLGFLAYSPSCIEGLFIDPRYHRRGLGGSLVAHAQMLSQGPLRLDVNEANPGAISFYRSLGFVVVGQSVTDGEGRPFPILHMQRRAEPSPEAA